MARTQGARNAGYDQRRWDLAKKVRAAVFADEGLHASLRELASVSGTTVSSLKHYFGDRQGVIRAALEYTRIEAAPHLAMASTPTHSNVRRSLEGFVAVLREAWVVHGVGNVQARSLASGLSARALGPTYVTSVLEPLLQSMEQLLRAHIQRGQLAPCDERFAALEFLSPLVLGLLHQDSLSGKTCRPLDLDAFVARHLDVFLAGHPARARRA